MKKSKSADVLADPDIQRHTERIMALREEERQTREKLGSIIVAIGAELAAVKEALDKLSDKTAWLRWLKEHVHYSARTAQNYMSVARFAEKTKALSFFLEMEPTVLYRLAALPDEIAATLTPYALLTDPRTGRQVPLKEMSARSFFMRNRGMSNRRTLKEREDKPFPTFDIRSSLFDILRFNRDMTKPLQTSPTARRN